MTISQLLGWLEITSQYALVERNGSPVPRESFAVVKIVAGDELVVARPVAGG